MTEVEWWYITWGFTNDDQKKAMMEIVNSGSDRAVGILAATMLEDRLLDCLKRHLVTDNRDINNSFFGVGGIAGDFGAKIQFAYLLGVISEPGMKDLKTISRIRNKFAHELLARDFQSNSVKNLCMNLKLVEERVREILPLGDPRGESIPLPALKDPKQKFMYAVNNFMSALLASYPRTPLRPLF